MALLKAHYTLQTYYIDYIYRTDPPLPPHRYLNVSTQLTHDVAATLPVSAQLVTRDVTFWQRRGNVVATL